MEAWTRRGEACFARLAELIVNFACESSDCSSDRRRAWGYGITLGGAAGALGGAGIGGRFPRWDQKVP